MTVNRDKRENPPVIGSEAELHGSVAAVACRGLPSDSTVLIFATVRGETRNCVTKKELKTSSWRTLLPTDITIGSTCTWLLITQVSATILSCVFNFHPIQLKLITPLVSGPFTYSTCEVSAIGFRAQPPHNLSYWKNCHQECISEVPNTVLAWRDETTIQKAFCVFLLQM